jgi:hypothetical protein
VAKYQRWVACFDTHGDQLDPGASKAFKAFVEHWKPDIKIHGGDAFDFRWLRRSCSDEEKAADVEADFEAGLDFLKWYRPDHFLWGNHDTRLVKLLDSTNGYARHLAGAWLDRISATIPRAKQYPYDRRKGVMTLGNYKVAHGYGHGVHAARAHALVYGNVMHGHVHRNSHSPVAGVEVRHGYSSGCLCNLDMDYEAPNMGTLAQEHGWLYGLVTRKGTVLVWQAQQLEGDWVLPSELRTIVT